MLCFLTFVSELMGWMHPSLLVLWWRGTPNQLSYTVLTSAAVPFSILGRGGDSLEEKEKLGETGTLYGYLLTDFSFQNLGARWCNLRLFEPWKFGTIISFGELEVPIDFGFYIYYFCVYFIMSLTVQCIVYLEIALLYVCYTIIKHQSILTNYIQQQFIFISAIIRYQKVNPIQYECWGRSCSQSLGSQLTGDLVINLGSCQSWP